MKLAPTAEKFLQAVQRGAASYAEIGESAGLTPDEVEAAFRDLLRAGCLELRPAVTNRGLAAMKQAA